jgi:curved DNA-binding protein
MEYKDYYQVLGVSARASAEEIRQVYKKLAVQYHPDHNPGNSAAEKRFKEISEAKEVLLDPENRQKYDALRAQYVARQQLRQQRSGGMARPTPPEEEPEMSNVFTHFFEEVFGRKRSSRRGRNYEAHIKITLEEAYHGTRDVLGFEGRKLRIRIKPGMRDGQVLKIKGQGGPGKNGGPNGDLFLTVKIKDHPHFDRQADDLYTSLEIDLYTAVLGRKMQLPSLKGSSVTIQIPPGTQPGERLKLKGLGMPYHDYPGQYGDLYLTVKVKLPTRLSGEEQALFEQLARLRDR